MSFKNSDWVSHSEHGIGIVVWAQPDEQGRIRIHFCYERPSNQEICDWFDPKDLTINLNTHPALDANNNRIDVGDKLYCPMSKGGAGNGAYMKIGNVICIDKPTHRGYGYWTRQLKLKGDDGKKFTHNYPANCLIVSQS